MNAREVKKAKILYTTVMTRTKHSVYLWVCDNNSLQNNSNTTKVPLPHTKTIGQIDG